MSIGKHDLLKALGTISAYTLLSRLLGFVRDVIIARVLGAGLGADAFFVALKLPNFLRRLFAEGAFNTAFVPVFSDYLQQGNIEETRRASQAIFSFLLVVLLGVVLVVQIGMPLLIIVAAPGFLENTDKFNLTVALARITFPYILFISLVALAGGILNSHKRFAIPAATPIFLNVTMILGAYFLSPFFTQPAIGVALGVFFGGVVQLAIQLPPLAKIYLPLRFRWEPGHPAIKRVLTLMGPSLLGVSVAQVNLLFDLFLASFLAEGSVSYLYYADRLVEFPLGLFGIALSTAILPSFSQKSATQDMEGLRQQLDFALRLTLVTSIPASIGLILLREPILSLLFQRGAFTPETTYQTGLALMAFAFGLTAFSAVKVVLPAFYALKDTKTPVKIAIVCLVSNMVMNLIFIFPLRHAGLALSTALASYLNLYLLIRHLKQKIDYQPQKPVWLCLIKTLAASSIMAAAILLVLPMVWQNPQGTGMKLALLMPVLLGAMVLYWVSGKLLHLGEMSELISAFRRQPSPKSPEPQENEPEDSYLA